MKLFLLIFSILLHTATFSQTTEIRVDPNPFSNRAVVHYTLVTADTITVDVYTQWGQFILALRSNEFMNAGIYHDSLRMDTCADGKYVVIISNRSKNLKGAVFLKMINTSIQEAQWQADVFIYPNPVNDKLFIENISGRPVMNLKMINSSGQIISTKSITGPHECVDLTGLPPAVYYLQIGEDSRQVFKVVKE